MCRLSLQLGLRHTTGPVTASARDFAEVGGGAAEFACAFRGKTTASAAQPLPCKSYLITFYNHKCFDWQETIYLFFITKNPLTSCCD
jgi:hypothetical protein